MRDLETERLRKKREHDNIPETEEEIQQVKRKIHGAGSPLSQEITLSQLVYLVSKELQHKRPAKKLSIINYVFIFLTLFSLGAGAFRAFRMIRPKTKTGLEKGYDCEHNVMKYKYIKYYGQRSRLDGLVRFYVSMFQAFDKYNDEKLESEYKPTNRNIILYGPPGTGKTLFVKVFSYLLEISLRLEIYKSKNLTEITTNSQLATNDENNRGSGAETPSLNTNNTGTNPGNNKKTSKITLKSLESIEPQVCLIAVRQSSFISKFVGETEKNLENLFKYAYDLSKQKAVIIFFDEIETVARKRTDATPDHTLNAISQFLNILDGPTTPLRKKVLLFGATNNKEMIDPAIYRRFYHKLCMPNPNKTQRSYMIKRRCQSYLHFNQNYHDRLVEISEGLSFDSIDKAFVDLRRRTKGPPFFITYDDFEKALKHQKNLSLGININQENDEEEPLAFNLDYYDADIDLPHTI